jgi:RNA-binding protein
MVLTPKQRQFLRGLAHPLAPVVRIGKGKLTDNVIAEAKKSLASHELIKIRVEADDGKERRELAEGLAAATDSQIAGVVGKTAILYRENEEKPRIRFPK